MQHRAARLSSLYSFGYDFYLNITTIPIVLRPFLWPTRKGRNERAGIGCVDCCRLGVLWGILFMRRLFSRSVALSTGIARRAVLGGALALAALSTVASAPALAAGTTIFAAASATDAVNDVIAAYKAASGKEVTPSYGSSSTLAQQIEQGAPATVFLSASPKWAKYLDEKGLLEPNSQVNLLGNTLVMIAPTASKLSVSISKDMNLAGLLGSERLSVGDPDHVPVGQYAKAALTSLGQWATVEPKLARASDVRGALALVERGETPLGIVYSTDAAISKDVKVIATFPQDSYDKITYPAALVKGADAESKAFFSFLTSSPIAKEIFAKYGFQTK